MHNNKPKLAFIGLGVMGFPMAGHLANAGYSVTVFNRTQEKAVRWTQEYVGKYAATPADAAAGCDMVFLCVGNDDDVTEVTLGEQGVLSTMQANTILVDHTTASADIARVLSNHCQKKGVQFMDAPVSGGQAGAENGKLTVMLGGAASAFESVKEVIACYSQSARLLGPAGSGQLAKMMNQICIAGIVQGLAEALQFGTNAGMDCAAVIDVISKGAAQSWQMENRAKTMIEGEYNFGFAVDWMRKDLNIALNEARRNGSTLPLTALVDQFYADVQKAGNGRYDTSSLLTRFSGH
ncbi:NAD(P)-dependent oxidoreductase [Alteromonas sediminis]|uniref:NAD(P)-dependent oxidoreductase n=1 Tax=Alteromonas sediminis TaxID=2259342 RepID=A0A3N5Z987_9ALTE|nr:NAD(P)-dependent oxidoreductase [Alteromonas sediminis]